MPRLAPRDTDALEIAVRGTPQDGGHCFGLSMARAQIGALGLQHSAVASRPGTSVGGSEGGCTEGMPEGILVERVAGGGGVAKRRRGGAGSPGCAGQTRVPRDAFAVRYGDRTALGSPLAPRMVRHAGNLISMFGRSGRGRAAHHMINGHARRRGHAGLGECVAVSRAREKRA